MKRAFLTLLLLIGVGCCWATAAKDCPARCRVTTNLNVRSGPSRSAPKIGLLQKDSYVTVEYTKGTPSDRWGAIRYNGKRGYVSMQYLSAERDNTSDNNGNFSLARLFRDIGGFFSHMANKRWTLPLVILAALALLFSLSFISTVARIVYYAVSFPFYWLNQLEHLLVEPWRYAFRHDWVGDNHKPALRIALEVVSVVLYIAVTPLRILNAVVYNLLIHCLASLYDLTAEVIVPCDKNEGAGNTGRWVLMLPWRLLKYLLFHGTLTIVESIIWTAIDIVVPARTLYHGTDLAACEAITADPQRNMHLKRNSKWTTGTFLASTHPNCTWAGRGVYFAINRSLALGYSDRARSLLNDPVMIACRVSLGRVVNYTLLPSRVYRQAGNGGNHDELNKFGDSHRYTTGEWYNNRQHWEYCLFDWQNRYNHPWRIRPVYVINTRTFRPQHIRGGVQHWLFDKAVWKDIFS